MNPVLLYFASGESLYSGAGLMLVMVAMSPYLKRRWLLRVRNVATWLALALMLMACPPFAWIVDVIFAAVFLIWFITWNRSAKGRIWLRMRTPTMVPIFLLLLGLPAVEWSHRRMPVIEGEASDHLVVIGDSISAGLGSRVLPWPAIMQQMTKLDVRNLSRPGTTMSDGESRAEKVTAEDHLILIELGGNDLIAGESSDVFAQALNAVLARLAVPGRTLVMFERTAVAAGQNRVWTNSTTALREVPGLANSEAISQRRHRGPGRDLGRIASYRYWRSAHGGGRDANPFAGSENST